MTRLWPKWYRPTPRRVFGFEMVQRAAKELGIAPDELLGATRKCEVIAARAAIVRVLRKQGVSYPVIGKAIKRDHTTAQHLDKVYPVKTRHPEHYARFLHIFESMRMAA